MACTINPALLTPLATLVVGLSVAFIAFQQWVLARHKFRLDLFDRRYKVYEATKKFLSVIMAHADFTIDDLMDFNTCTNDSVFLFGTEIKDYIHKIRISAVDMQKYGKQFRDLSAGEERSKIVDKHHKELVWLTDQLVELPKVFTKYLGFKSVM